MTTTSYGEKAVWAPKRPKIGLVRLLVSWLLATLSLLFAAWIVPGASIESFGGALLAAAVIAILNALLPPLVALLLVTLFLQADGLQLTPIVIVAIVVSYIVSARLNPVPTVPEAKPPTVAAA